MSTNYCAELLDAIAKSSEHAKLGEQIKRAVKFRLPENGMVLDIKNTGSIKTKYEPYVPVIKLPYALIALEYTLTDGAGKQQPLITLAMQNDNDIGIKCIFRHSTTGQWGVLRGTGRMLGQWGEFKIGADSNDTSDLDSDELRRYVNYAAHVILTLLAALACSNSNIVDDVAPSKLKQDMRKRKGKQPLFTYKVLTIDTQKNVTAGGSGTGSHTSPRVHLRRGHIRRLPDKNVWVNACLVGDKSKGMITKDYRVV